MLALWRMLMTNVNRLWTLNGAKEKLAAYMLDATESGKHLGLSLAVADHNDVHFLNHGYRSMTLLEEISENHFFEIGSVGKVFTAILVACLIEEGACHAEDLIGRYVPETGAFGDSATVIELLTHRSGLPQQPRNFEFIAPLNSYKAYGEAKLVQGLEGLSKPRSKGRFSYSSFGYLILGVMAKRVTGHLRFIDALNEKVLAPLKLHDTKFNLTAVEMARLCHGHSPELEPVMPYLDLGEVYVAAGALKATTADMIKFVRFFLDPALIPHDMRKPVTQTLRLMTDQHDARVSFGWHVRSDTEPVCYYHPGSLAGTKSLILFSPALRRGIAYNSNTLSHVRPIWDILLGSLK